jgi:hypothetical protein
MIGQKNGCPYPQSPCNFFVPSFFCPLLTLDSVPFDRATSATARGPWPKRSSVGKPSQSFQRSNRPRINCARPRISINYRNTLANQPPRLFSAAMKALCRSGFHLCRRTFGLTRIARTTNHWGRDARDLGFNPWFAALWWVHVNHGDRR